MPSGHSQPPVPDDLFLRLQEALAGEYSLDRELGRGGMGVVYLAREVRLARHVAIKVLPPALAESPERRAQFLREAQTAARLSHPNIVPIHRVNETGGFVYFVMSYVDGETLAQRIARRGPLAPHHAVRVLREVAWALTYAHGSGIIHRDVKADNILLERAGDRAIVTDFGIAGATQTNVTNDDGAVVGSPHYASPEQIAGQPVSEASDVYSLGVVAFYALTGRLPFDAATVREILAMHLGARPPSVVSVAPAVPATVARLVDSCLAKRAEDRPASAAAFAEALGAAIEPRRELPAPVRVWLNGATQTARWQIAGGLVLGEITGFSIGSATGNLIAGVVSGAAAFGIAGVLPQLLRMNRLLAAGYGIDDVRAAIREYWMRRREEQAYELTALPGRISRGRALGILYGSGLAATALQAMRLISRSGWIAPLTALAAIAAVSTGALALSQWARLKLNRRLGSSQIRFYDGAWGARWVRLAGLGLPHRAVAPALSQLTEVALGRATEALFDALPRQLRRELARLPETVRRLEGDARNLRDEIEKLDASLEQLVADGRASVPSTVADTPREPAVRAERERLQTDLRRLRDTAAARLASIVAALENIRLGLLRLQLGERAVESITATLDAASEMATDVAARADANAEIRRLLGAPPLAPHTSLP